MRAAYKWVRDNALSIVFILLFVVVLAAQAWAGFRACNEQLRAHSQPALHFGRYLTTGEFLDGIFSNWQAAILQLGCLIVFSGILRQRGASHSLKGEGDPEKGSAEKRAKKTTAKKTIAQKRKNRSPKSRDSWLYRNSLSLAFGALFLASFGGHLVFGHRLFNETNALSDLPPISLGHYARSARFWFTTVQTWEAEFGVIAVFIILSIFLRQEGSAESKPVESSDEETGETNK